MRECLQLLLSDGPEGVYLDSVSIIDIESTVVSQLKTHASVTWQKIKYYLEGI